MSTLNVNSIQTAGGASPVLTADIAKKSELIASSGSSLVGHIASGTGAVATTVEEKLREHVSVLDFGLVGNGVVDNTAASNAAVSALNAAGVGALFFPEGDYFFNSKPNAISGGILLIGSGYYKSRLTRNYTEVSSTAGFIDMTGASNGGGGITNLLLFAASGTSGGSAINIEAGVAHSNGDMVISDISVTGEGTWNYNIRADGSAKVTSAQGVRTVRVRDCVLFQANIAGIYLKSVNNWSLSGIGIFTGTGTDFILDGTSEVPSNYVSAKFTFCPNVSIGPTGACNQVLFDCPNTVNMTVTGHVFNITMLGKFSTVVGTPSGDADSVGFATSAKVVGGKLIQTSGGGNLETSNGVTFPSTPIAIANVNTLDCYVEGTFTPIIGGSTTAGTVTYTIQQGKYTRIGNVVHFQFRLGWSNIGDGCGYLRVFNLPCAASSGVGD